MDEIYLSASDVAQHINSKVRTIENWAAAGKLAQNERGKYGLVSALKYQLEKAELDLAKTKLVLGEVEDKLERATCEARKDAQDAKDRKTIAEADKEEALAAIKQLELQKLEEKLVDAEEVKEVWKNGVANVKAKLIGIPAKMALELSGLDKPEDIQSRLTTVIDEALIELGNG